MSALLQNTFVANFTGDEVALLTVALCLVLAAAGWWILAEPVKTVRKKNTKAKRKTVAAKSAKRKSKK